MGPELAKYLTARFTSGTAPGDAAAERYGVQAFPTLLVVNRAGAVVDEVDWGSPAELAADLARVRAGRDTLLALRERHAEAPGDLDVRLALAARLVMRAPQEAEALVKEAEGELAAATPDQRARALLVTADSQVMRDLHAAALAGYMAVLRAYPKTRHAEEAAMMATNALPMADVEEGLAWITEALGLAPGEDARTALEDVRAVLYERGADEALLRRGNEAGDDAELLNHCAWECFLRNRHTTAAIGWARRAVELSGRAPHVLDTLANLLDRAGELEEAIRLEQEALERAEDPKDRALYEEILARMRAAAQVRAAR